MVDGTAINHVGQYGFPVGGIEKNAHNKTLLDKKLKPTTKWMHRNSIKLKSFVYHDYKKRSCGPSKISRKLFVLIIKYWKFNTFSRNHSLTSLACCFYSNMSFILTI